jgi:hypothetical protein
MMTAQEAQEALNQAKKKQNDEALKLFRERWWDRLHKTRLYQLIHGTFMGRASEVTIVMRKDNKIALRSWCSRKADKNQEAAFNVIYRYIYWMGDNMAIVDQYHRNMNQLHGMIEDYKKKHGQMPDLDELFKSAKPTLQ